MNSLTAEKRYQFAKWAEIIKSCKSSGMQVSEWLKQNNISKDQYYYWQRKLKDACLESLQAEQSTFIELPVEVERCRLVEINIYEKCIADDLLRSSVCYNKY